MGSFSLKAVVCMILCRLKCVDGHLLSVEFYGLVTVNDTKNSEFPRSFIFLYHINFDTQYNLFRQSLKYVIEVYFYFIVFEILLKYFNISKNVNTNMICLLLDGSFIYIATFSATISEIRNEMLQRK